LTLVKEVMTRHQGRIDVCNVANGVRVVLVF
jgi:hypothetical protein